MDWQVKRNEYILKRKEGIEIEISLTSGDEYYDIQLLIPQKDARASNVSSRGQEPR